MRSTCTTTDGRDARYRFRRVSREDPGARRRRMCGSFILHSLAPILVGIEATGSMQWFLELMEELGIECRVGHPAKIRSSRTTQAKIRSKRCRAAANSSLRRIAFQRSGCPRASSAICARCYVTVISGCACDPESSTHCNRWHSITVSGEDARYGAKRASMHSRALPLAPHANERRKALMTLYPCLQESIEKLDRQVSQASRATSPGTATDDAPGSRADHRVSH